MLSHENIKQILDRQKEINKNLNTKISLIVELMDKSEENIIALVKEYKELNERIQTVQEWKNDFVSWSLQITGIITGIFAVILAIYVGVIQSNIFVERFDQVIIGAMLFLGIAIVAYIIWSIKIMK